MRTDLEDTALSQREHGLPWWLSNKESSCNAGATGDVGSIPGLGRSPEEWQPTPVFLPEESHGQRNLVGYNP